MANTNSTVVNQNDIATSPPQIDLPNSVNIDSSGRVYFDKTTTLGLIQIHQWKDRWECRGSLEALSGEKLLCPSWLPGLEGNNVGSQLVFFGENGPWLYRGNPRNKIKKLGLPHIAIRKTGSERYSVSIPMTAAQHSLINSRMRELQLEDAQAKARQKLDKLVPDLAAAKQYMLNSFDCDGAMFKMHLDQFRDFGIDGFYLTERSYRKLEDAAAKLWAIAVEEIELQQNHFERRNIEDSIKIEVARADAKFSEFLGKITESGG